MNLNKTQKNKLVDLTHIFGMCGCASLAGIEETYRKGTWFKGCGNCLDERIKRYLQKEREGNR